ncbi:MAG TPA: glycosyltransferase 87 family protein, partial [Dehalococcoidia bacterium]|nr:glycosyltransferase 87 family protein [Dehalococcoidia bacterium]
SLYISDVTAFTHFDAQLLLTGHNPYTADSAFGRALLAFPGSSPTPIRSPLFGPTLDLPSTDVIKPIEQRFLAGDSLTQGAFDPRTLHSYPALAYLLYAPALLLHLPNILIVNVLALLALYAWLVRVASPAARHWTLVVALAAVTIPFDSLLSDTEVICVALLLLAWHYRDRRYLGPVLLGLACAFKQYPWYFAPFFLLDAAHEHGWREAGRRGLIALGAFLLPNLPFLIASPQAWWTSLWLPLADPMYPMGIGIISLSHGHIVPYGGPPLYLALEVLAIGACLWGAWRLRAQLGDAMLILALVPLYFAFRSPTNYFAFAPILALYAANHVCSSRLVRLSNPQLDPDSEILHAQ